MRQLTSTTRLPASTTSVRNGSGSHKELEARPLRLRGVCRFADSEVDLSPLGGRLPRVLEARVLFWLLGLWPADPKGLVNNKNLVCAPGSSPTDSDRQLKTEKWDHDAANAKSDQSVGATLGCQPWRQIKDLTPRSTGVWTAVSGNHRTLEPRKAARPSANDPGT